MYLYQIFFALCLITLDSLLGAGCISDGSSLLCLWHAVKLDEIRVVAYWRGAWEASELINELNKCISGSKVPGLLLCFIFV